jgi:hypothetical protein
MTHHDDLHGDELQLIATRLRAERPQATALELDAIKRRVLARAAGSPRRRARSADLMKSRLAILSAIVVGGFMSFTGAGLALDGVTHSASKAVYGSNNVPTQTVLPTPSGNVLGETEQKGGQPAGEQAKGQPAGGNAVQPARQVAGTTARGTLPFTGFAAIPVLIGGLALLSAGLVLRRRSIADQG